MPFKFENLNTWQQAVNYSEKVHLVTKTFPQDELYGLSNQFRRAADSVALNIAEGSIGQSDKEQQKFLSYSIRSIAECVSCLYLAIRRKYIDQATFTTLYDDAESLFVRLCRFRSSLNPKAAPKD